MTSDETKIAVLAVRQERMEGDLTRLEQSLCKLDKRLDEIHDFITETRGAWKASSKIAVGAGTAAGFLSPFIHKIFPFLR